MKAGPIVLSTTQKGWKNSSSSCQTLMVHSFEIPTVQAKPPLRANSQALGHPRESQDLILHNLVQSNFEKQVINPKIPKLKRLNPNFWRKKLAINLIY